MGRSVLKYTNQNTDIFHVHFAYPGGGIIPLLKMKYPNIPVVLSVHGNDWYINKENKKIEERIYNGMCLSDRIITVGSKLKENIAEYLIYMYQIEDLIRANEFDPVRIEQSIINKFDASYEVKREMLEWYKSLIEGLSLGRRQSSNIICKRRFRNAHQGIAVDTAVML